MLPFLRDLISKHESHLASKLSAQLRRIISTLLVIVVNCCHPIAAMNAIRASTDKTRHSLSVCMPLLMD